MFDVALFACQAVRFKQEGVGVVLVVFCRMGSRDVGGDPEGLAPDSHVMA